MKKRTAIYVLFAVLAVGVTLPTQASAFTSYYNCVLKPVGQWCDGRANGSYDGQHSWDYNEGWYPGSPSGVVWTCEHVLKPSSGNELGGGGWCAYDWISHYYGNVQCACYDAEVRQYSGGPHSINGYADADY